jgi:UDP-2,4-diacetamido-2,4,6-trideoxy-beta-L-altropyranose hydrolase
MISLLIRADASPAVGTGHVMRCLALAQAAQAEGIQVCIVGRIQVPWVQDCLRQENIFLKDILNDIPTRERPEDLLAQIEGTADWIALDGYHFDHVCQQRVRESGYNLIVIDDYNHLPEYHCDILLNQNIGSEDFVYTGNISRKLLGPKYALLRSEFTAARPQAENRIFPEKVKNILLTLGGGDFSPYLDRIAPALAVPDLSDCALRVIAGSMPEARIRAALRDCTASLEILRQVDNMPAFMLQTDLCITSAGSICWELCCMGIPFLTICIAKNQESVAVAFSKFGIASEITSKNLSLYLKEYAMLLDLRNKIMNLVDGNGANRIIISLFESSES